MSDRCFISHASEDKESIVRTLAHELKRRAVNIWYDEFSLNLGGSLRCSIDRGLAEFESGVVIQVKATLFTIQVSQKSVRVDADALEDGRDVIRDLAPLVGMDGPTATVHQLQVIVIGKRQAVIGVRGSRKRKQFRDGLLQGLGSSAAESAAGTVNPSIRCCREVKSDVSGVSAIPARMGFKST